MADVSQGREESYHLHVQERQAVLHLGATVLMYNAGDFGSVEPDIRALREVDALVLDCSAVADYDSYLALLISRVRRACRERGMEFRLAGASDSLGEFLAFLHSEEEFSPPDIAEESPLRRSILHIGEFSQKLSRDTRDFITFVGALVQNLLVLPLRFRSVRWKDFPYLYSAAAVDAVPIVVLIGFLVGLIIGYQGAIQLREFGADIYLADLIGISVTRELGPLMTAIIVAGRSGAAFAAEIGTMKVSEEVDALRSLGFDLMRFLIVPRVLAVSLAMPFLTIFADLAGIFGGLVTGLATLDITIGAYVGAIQDALNFAHVFSGVGKSVVFGFLIATLGCFRGLQVHGGAESVGKYTTQAVVSGIFLIILSDAVFAFIFQILGI